MTDKVTLGKLATGVPGLDVLLGGGLSEFSFNLIAGAPGCGKTTLAHQIMFGLATPERKALYFTVLGEPPLKMLRYQQQYGFFDIDRVGNVIQYINLADDLRSGDFSKVLERITKEVEHFSPGLVFVDSFRSVVQTARSGNEGVADLQHFVQELGTRMASWQATTFLIGEYLHPETEANPILTVADGLIGLSQPVEENSVIRKLRVVKMRGQAHVGGYHTFRMGAAGIQVYPRLLPGEDANTPLAVAAEQAPRRLLTGVATLDEMLGGGIPAGYSVLFSGPTGTGKTITSTSFLAAGAALGEKGVIASFEKSASRLRNPKLVELVNAGHVSFVQRHAIDMPVEEVVDDLVDLIKRTQATRVVIDSLSELTLYLAPEDRANFREVAFRLLAALARTGATVIVTLGMEDRFTDLRFSHSDISVLVDAVISTRYVEVEGQLRKMISVVKVRGSDHSKDLRSFEITGKGLEIGERLAQYEGLLSGHPVPTGPTSLGG